MLHLSYLAYVGRIIDEPPGKGRAMRHILVVDPSRSFTRYVEVVVTRLGYRCLSAGSGGDGLQILKSRMPDMILCETALPDMTGGELLERIRSSQRTKHIPVIALTTDSQTIKMAGREASVFDEVLLKPITVRDLFETVQVHIHSNTRRKNLRAPMSIVITCKDGTEHRSHITMSIGEGGMFVETETPREIGRIIDIDLPLPGLEESVAVQGEIIYSVGSERPHHPPGMGVKFINMDEETRMLLCSYMENYLEGMYPGTGRRSLIGLTEQGDAASA